MKLTDLYIIVDLDRNSSPVPAIDGATDDVFMVLRGGDRARQEARRQSRMYQLNARAVRLDKFLNKETP